jgi:CHAT domain-containing protein
MVLQKRRNLVRLAFSLLGDDIIQTSEARRLHLSMRSSIYQLILLLIIFVSLTVAQPGNNLLNEYRKAEQFYNLANSTRSTDLQALQLYLQAAKKLNAFPAYDSITFDCYLKAGILQESDNDHAKAIQLFSTANSIQRRSKLADSFRFKPYLFTGSAYYYIANYDSAVFYFNEAEKLVAKYPHISEQQRLYNMTGSIYYEAGNYVQSKYYFEKALAILDTNARANQYLLVNYKNNIASVSRKLHDYPHALDLYQSLLQYGVERDALLQNIGDTYLGMGEYKNALHYINSTRFVNAKKYNDLAFCYMHLDKPDSAMLFLDKALQHSASVRKSIEKGTTLSYYGDLMAAKKPSDALGYYQKAIIQMDPDFTEEQVSKNPTQFNGIHSFGNLFETLVHKAEAFHLLFNSTKDSQNLEYALKAMNAAFNLSDHTAEAFGSDEARLFLNENVQPAYQLYVDWGVELYEITHDNGWLKDAIAHAEKSKAAVLQWSLLQIPLWSLKGIPHDLLQEEKNLKASISAQYLSFSTTQDSTVRKSSEGQLMNDQIQLSKVHDKLNQQPAYKTLWGNHEIKVDEIRSRLGAQDAIVSLFFSRNSLFSFVVTKDSIAYHQSNEVKTITDEITFLVQHADDASADKQEARKLLQGIYQQVIQPLLPLLTGKSSVIIIPHNELAYLPFEMLIDESGRYALEKFAISYNYSMAFLKAEQQLQFNKLLVAFAPFAGESSASKQFESIPASKQEVSSLNGQVFIDSLATKQKFVQLSSQIGVAHLATHAAANDSIPLQSFIAFYPQEHDTSFKLFEPEIYNLDMHASKLVVLSACETGSGKLVHGEGLLSLSRAFSYAGCPSIITSLWKADDIATAYICGRLHHYLKKGWKKDLALQTAKLDYLKDETIPDQFKLPRFWANLVLVGDTSAIYEGSKSPTVTIIILLIALVIVLFVAAIIYKKRKARGAGLVP